MPGPDPHDDTSADREQFERALLVQNRDATGVDTADIPAATAQNPVSDHVDADVVTPVPKDQVPVHGPSGTPFDSTTQLAVFHCGRTAGRDADAEGECCSSRSLAARSVTSRPVPRLARRAPGGRTSGVPTRSASTVPSR